ncbi:MAG TPA: hypothetical protein PLM41_01710 [Saprospiraceae bacterium]|nr:hypothetical protein [Saprospiraceae bacterium]
MKPAVIVLSLLCTLPGFVFSQSPWTRDKAGFYIQASWRTIPTYKTIFDRTAENRQRTLEREISENSFHFLAEYGITHKTLVWVDAPLRFMHSGAQTGTLPVNLKAGTLRGLGNISLACRQNFLSKKINLSGQIRVDLPGTKVDPATGLSTGFDAIGFSALLSLGQRQGRWYWFGYGGWGARGLIGNSALLGGGEAGFKINRNWFAFFSDLSWNVGSDTYFVPPANERTGLFLPRQSYWNAGAKGMLAFGRFFGGIVVITAPIDGNLISRQPAFTAGLYFKWD